MAQTSDWAGTRRLLRLLRDVMRKGDRAEDKLDRVVELIAQDMVAEVCSIYAMRPGEVLELFATKGLKREAVHRTRLRLGEGLVGQIAYSGKALALADAQSHPNFAYRPETGEEVFHSLMGVPIQRGGRVLGVLVIQNKTARSYDEEEIEALETVAMVVAEMIAGGELISLEEIRQSDGLAMNPARLTGLTLNGGLAMGLAVPHHRGIVIRQIVAENQEQEEARLAAALDAMRSDIDSLLDRPELQGVGESREVIETYRLFADDRGWLGRIEEAIRGGLTAEAAAQRVQNDTRARMAKVKDPYIRERLADLDDLANRLLSHLVGGEGNSAERLPENAVLVARELGPAELLDYDRSRLKAVVLEEGSPTAHVAIVARALGIPMVGRLGDLLRQSRPGDFMIVDGENAQVFLRPGHGVRDSFAAALIEREARRESDRALALLPSVTRDGVEVSLWVNAGLLVDVPSLHETGAAGIGLYRTEVPFMVRESFPDVAAQRELYQNVLAQAKGKPVVFRTLDIGGDKALPYWKGEAEDNPALGWRAIRIGLDRPAMLRQQLRALVEAAAGQALHIMFPMISAVPEFESARELLDRELALARARGLPPPTSLSVGVMLEVPALVWQLPLLLPQLDFLSVGSNDLLQFLFASDRGNPRLARRYDSLSPAALSFFSDLAREVTGAGVPLSLCGEIAGQPLDAMALVACGFRRLSMAPSSLGRVKAMVRSLDLGHLEGLIGYLCQSRAPNMRGRLRAFAHDHDVAI